MTFSKSSFIKLCLFLVILVTCIAWCNKQIKETVITGSIVGAKDQWVKVWLYQPSGIFVTANNRQNKWVSFRKTKKSTEKRTPIDSFQIIDEQFMYRLHVDKCYELNLILDGKYGETMTMPFYVDEGSKIVAKGNIDSLSEIGLIDIMVEGSITHEQAVATLEQNRNKNFNLREIENFITENSSSQLSGSLLAKYIMMDKMYSKEERKIGQHLYNILSDDVKNSFYGKIVSQELLRKYNSMPSGTAFDFIAYDVNNEKLELSKLESKYTLIHFWSPWLVKNQNIEELKKLHAKYHDEGLEIVSIASDGDGEKSWKRAIEEEGIGNWKHILNDDELKIKDRYDMLFSNASFILDDDRKILKRVEPEKFEEITKYVDNLFP